MILSSPNGKLNLVNLEKFYKSHNYFEMFLLIYRNSEFIIEKV